MLKLVDKLGKLIGILKDDDTEPKLTKPVLVEDKKEDSEESKEKEDE